MFYFSFTRRSLKIRLSNCRRHDTRKRNRRREKRDVKNLCLRSRVSWNRAMETIFRKFMSVSSSKTKTILHTGTSMTQMVKIMQTFCTNNLHWKVNGGHWHSGAPFDGGWLKQCLYAATSRWLPNFVPLGPTDPPGSTDPLHIDILWMFTHVQWINRPSRSSVDRRFYHFSTFRPAEAPKNKKDFSLVHPKPKEKL